MHYFKGLILKELICNLAILILKDQDQPPGLVVRASDY